VTVTNFVELRTHDVPLRRAMESLTFVPHEMANRLSESTISMHLCVTDNSMRRYVGGHP